MVSDRRLITAIFRYPGISNPEMIVYEKINGFTLYVECHMFLFSLDGDIMLCMGLTDTPLLSKSG